MTFSFSSLSSFKVVLSCFHILFTSMARDQASQPYFGLKGGWLTFWVTVACATDMMLFGYDQGVFGMSFRSKFPFVDSA